MRNSGRQPCPEWADKLAMTYMEDLPPDDRIALYAHLETCVKCKLVYQEYRFLDEKIRDIPTAKLNPKVPFWQLEAQWRADSSLSEEDSFVFSFKGVLDNLPEYIAGDRGVTTDRPYPELMPVGSKYSAPVRLAQSGLLEKPPHPFREQLMGRAMAFVTVPFRLCSLLFRLLRRLFGEHLLAWAMAFVTVPFHLHLFSAVQLPGMSRTQLRRFIIILVAIVCGVLTFAGGSLLLLARYGPALGLSAPNLNIARTTSVTLQSEPTTRLETSTHIKTMSDGELIGISDGSFAFDVSRPDGTLKRQAADRLSSNDVSGAESLWQTAIQQETNDAETLIYREDLRVLASRESYITIIVVTMLTGNDSASISSGRGILQGAYIEQETANVGYSLPHGTQVRLLIANAGSKSQYGLQLADMIIQVSKSDRTVIGVMGWPFSSGQAVEAIHKLSNAGITVISPTASSDELTGIPHFFRVVPPDSQEGAFGARYAQQYLHATRAALFVDDNYPYSKSLAQDFEKQFTLDGNQVVVTEDYTVGKPETLPDLLKDAMSHKPDLIYFAGYSSDVSALLANLGPCVPSFCVQITGGSGLYELGGYPPAVQSQLPRLHFTSPAYADAWSLLGKAQPTFFTTYQATYDPNKLHLLNPYGYSRPTHSSILAYDAMQALLEGYTLIEQSKTRLSLTDAMHEISGPQAIQGVSGRISFDDDGNPTDKFMLVLHFDQYNHIQFDASQGCFLISDCS